MDMSSPHRRPRAIILPFPADGHITPLLRLSKILWATGFAITFVNNEGNHARLLQTAKLSGHSWLLHEDPNFRLVGLAMEETPKLSENDGGKSIIYSSFSMMKPFEKLVESEMCAENGGPVSCIIYNYLMYWASDIATRFGIQKVAFFPSSAASYLLIKGIGELLGQGVIPIPEGFKDPVISLIPDLPITLEEAPFLTKKDTGVDVLCKGVFRMKEADWVLANTFEELEPKLIEQIRKDIEHFLPVAPLHSFSKEIGLTVQDRSCLKWLDTQAPRSVLYVAFGSLCVIHKTQLRNIAEGVKCSKKPFLWVQRSNLTGNEDDVDFISEILQESRGIVVRWAPQVEVLAHPSIGGFFTHCGWNSTLESISAGVPMLGWPCMSDQYLNLKYMTTICKIALDFKDCSRDDSGFISPHDVSKFVLRLMDGNEGEMCRSKIQELKDLAFEAAGGSSNINLHTLLDSNM